ncbi:NAD(P)/FAD-dependent oxidoreductase [Sandaracinobacteroides saxicola]|uniref:NAD(P)-binding protein n=1 Tax=Sandaracinobacteroides saxicola TaxID=2759707 RepID=A0A7G5IF26_9SPHN|nr:NAD(P)-binding protein [Sandaracinobacteroides saxicola]QMW21968.1 NAD(P)-binding protein [Sandaracinobacteroides saxicola]
MNGTLIIGGGLAGAASAALLAKAGQRVTLWERERHPHHKVCGEFLSGEAVAWLRTLDIDVTALGASHLTHVRVTSGSRAVAAKLPFAAAGLSRRVLDEALLDRAAALGAEVERGVTAREIAGDSVQSSHGSVAPARILLATGKHELRGARRDSAGTLNGLVGFKTHLRLLPGQRAALAGHVELHLFPGGYAGLQMVERDAANLCLLLSPERLAASGGSLDGVIDGFVADAPLLAARLHGATALFDRPLAISGVPYGFLHRAAPGETLFRLGDQAAVIPSFCGDGMAIALHSARLAANALLLGQPPAAYHDQVERDVGRPVRLAARAQRLVGTGGSGHPRLLSLAALWPGSLALAARLTRVPGSALRRAGLVQDTRPPPR